MFRHISLLASALLCCAGLSAQSTVCGSKFFDNWSATLKGGVAFPATDRGGYDNASPRAIFGVELRKDLTPVIGLGVEGDWTTNTSAWVKGMKEYKVIDHQYVGAIATVNFSNLFGGYGGAPRLFEVEGVLGAGWIHSYYSGHDFTTSEIRKVRRANAWGTKTGLNLNFNLGSDRAWTVSLKPALLWDMGATHTASLPNNACYNINAAVVEVQAGVTYHFGNSNGAHHFTLFRGADPAIFEAMNNQINDLRAQIAARDTKNETYEARVASIQSTLDECVSRPAIVKEVTVNLNNVHYVFFANASHIIQPNQQPVVAMAADALKADPNAMLTINGYASPVGSQAFNERLAQRRAEAVKTELVDRYGIAPSRIKATGMGVGSVFSNPDWNRMAVITIE